jgi:hypothetical protein
MEYFERLSDMYGLACLEQDMGICSADGNRLDEFISIFLKHEAIDPWEYEELADLVFESANEVITTKGLRREQEDLIVLLVCEHKEKFPQAMKYWLGLKKQDYPIIRLVEAGNH